MNAVAAWSLADGDNKNRYFAMSDEEREAFHGWFALHGVDHHDVPLEAVIEYDTASDEWLIPVFLRRDGLMYVDENNEPARGVERRPRKADAPVLPAVVA